MKGPDVGFSPAMEALFLRPLLLHQPHTQVILLDSFNPTPLSQASGSLNSVEGTFPENFAGPLASILCHMTSTSHWPLTLWKCISSIRILTPHCKLHLPLLPSP